MGQTLSEADNVIGGKVLKCVVDHGVTHSWPVPATRALDNNRCNFSLARAPRFANKPPVRTVGFSTTAKTKVLPRLYSVHLQVVKYRMEWTFTKKAGLVYPEFLV